MKAKIVIAPIGEGKGNYNKNVDKLLLNMKTHIKAKYGSIDKFANSLGNNRVTVTNVLNGDPKFSTLNKYADNLGINVRYFLTPYKDYNSSFYRECVDRSAKLIDIDNYFDVLSRSILSCYYFNKISITHLRVDDVIKLNFRIYVIDEMSKEDIEVALKKVNKIIF